MRRFICSSCSRRRRSYADRSTRTHKATALPSRVQLAEASRGMYFGLKDAPLPPAERDAQAAARRAQGARAVLPRAPPTPGRRISQAYRVWPSDQHDRTLRLQPRREAR